MPRTATLYNINCSQIHDQLASRGYADYKLLQLQAKLDTDVGPVEYTEPQFAWFSVMMNVVLFVYVLLSRFPRR